MILHSKPWIAESDSAVVTEALLSNMVGQGVITERFERLIASWVGVENSGVAVGSGAAAILLAMSALGIGQDDEVVFPSYVCRSVLDAVVSCRAVPVPCDVGEDWRMKAEHAESCVTKKTKAIIVPHLYGIFADIEPFLEFGIPVIEDCAQAVDYYGRRKVAGDIAVFSFHPTKCLTTGEGGMAVSADPGLSYRMRMIRDGGNKAGSGRVFSPMSDIASSLGISQLSRYHEALDRRKNMALNYMSALEDISRERLQYTDPARSMFFRFPLRVPGGLDLYGDMFAEKNICIRRGVDRLLHRELGLPDKKYPSSVRLLETTISLPIYPALTEEEHKLCVSAAVEILSNTFSGSPAFI